MKLNFVSLTNYRLVRHARVNLHTDGGTTVFVGPNNSGKTSVAEALRTFLSPLSKSFGFDDFWGGTLSLFGAFEAAALAGSELPQLPIIRMELVFGYSDAAEDLSVAEELLMDLDDAKADVVLRIEYAPKSPEQTATDFKAFREIRPEEPLIEMLREAVDRQYELRHYKVSTDGADVERIAPAAAATLLKRLIKIDFLPAQRHMEDQEATSQATKLSRLLHVHYERRFKTGNPESYAAVEAVVSAQALELTARYGEAFKEVTEALKLFGYPDTPEITVKAELSAGGIFKDSTKIYYVASIDPDVEGAAVKTHQLPERFNGLGFKNLIYMVLQLKAFRDALIGEDGFRPRVHLIVVEEPEAHLHPQMQTVFLRKAQAFLSPAGEEASQLVITTHSSHITAAAGLSAIRYFRKKGGTAVVKDLMTFKGEETAKGQSEAFEFVAKYLTLTRCDLFYADKAILIEGAVERLLLPKMIDACQADGIDLTPSYLSVVEVGGAYAHIFKDFLKFLGIPTLIITDIDSIKEKRVKCPVIQGITTSNATLTKWLPGMVPLGEIRAATDEQLTDGAIRVAFQVPEADEGPCGRSFEEAFCYANADWLHANKGKLLGTMELFPHESAAALAADAYNIEFPKADFAVDLMLVTGWSTPKYIKDGLSWLAGVQG